MTQSYVGTSSTAASVLQLARLKAGLSQRELADRAAVPTTMISAYERDKRQPTLATLLRLVRAAGFDLTMRLEPHDADADNVAALDSQQAERWRGAGLDDVIRSKERAGRPEDLRVLPALYRHQASRRSR